MFQKEKRIPRMTLCYHLKSMAQHNYYRVYDPMVLEIQEVKKLVSDGFYIKIN